MLALALPVLAENVLAMFVGWSDAILTGRILVEERYLAAAGACSYLIWLIESFAALVSTGCQAIVARLVGADRVDEANHIVVQSLLLAFVLGLVLRLLVIFGAESVVTALNLETQAKELAVVYLRIVADCCPFMMLMMVGTMCLRAAGHTFAGMLIMSTVNIVNIALSWALTCGVGPIEGWGWPGVATGTAISFGVGGLITLAWLIRGYKDLRIPVAVPKPDPASFSRILKIGIPGAANSLGMVLCHLWFLSIIGKLGTTAMAAHIVAIRCESLSWLTADAFAIAAATLIGQSLGARRLDLARLYGWLSCLLGGLGMSFLGIIFFTAAYPMFWLFVDPSQTEVIELGVPVLRLVAFTMPGMAAAIIFTGAMRGAGDTRWPLIYNTVGLVTVRIPLAYALTDWMPWGLFGAWVAMFVDIYARGLAATWRYLAAGWTTIEV